MQCPLRHVKVMFSRCGTWNQVAISQMSYGNHTNQSRAPVPVILLNHLTIHRLCPAFSKICSCQVFVFDIWVHWWIFCFVVGGRFSPVYRMLNDEFIYFGE